jgi:hypothetical protein
VTLTQTFPHPLNTFFPRGVNTTDIPFSDREETLLQKGPKYNLHNKPKNWLRNLALETETAISHRPPTEWDVYRKLAAKRISTLQKNSNPLHTHNTHQETKLIESIKTKLHENKAMITRADKGNSLIILTITKNPTNSFQSQIRKVLNDSKNLI